MSAARMNGAVVIFWDRLNWVPQSVLRLTKEDGGAGVGSPGEQSGGFQAAVYPRYLLGHDDVV